MAHGKLLQVEGKTDAYFFRQLYQNSKKQEPDFKIEPFKFEDKERRIFLEGIEALLVSLPTIISIADPSDIIGLVVDADEAVSRRWQRIRTILETAGYQNLPVHFSQEITLPTYELLPRLGVWIMPDNESEGMLENFIRKLIQEHDVLQPEVERVLVELKARVDAQYLFTDRKYPKAFIHTWLAWQKSPGMSYGTAWQERLFATDSVLCTRFIAWLNALFNA